MKIWEIFGWCLLAGHAFILVVIAAGFAWERYMNFADRRWRARLGSPPR
jgi:hypothetical protein